MTRFASFALLAVVMAASRPALAEDCAPGSTARVQAKPLEGASYLFAGDVRSGDCGKGDCAGTAMVGIDEHWTDGSSTHEEFAVPFRIKAGSGEVDFTVRRPLTFGEDRSIDALKGVDAHAHVFTCFINVE